MFPSDHFLGQQGFAVESLLAVVSEHETCPDVVLVFVWLLWVLKTLTKMIDRASSSTRIEIIIIHFGFLFGGQQSPLSHPQSEFVVLVCSIVIFY